MGIFLLAGSGISFFACVQILLGKSTEKRVSRFERTQIVEQIIGLLNRHSNALVFLKEIDAEVLERIAKELSRECSKRGYVLTHTGAYMAALLFVVLGALLCLVISLSWIGAIVGGLGAGLVLIVWSQSQERKRASFVAQQVPSIYRSLASALASGRTLSQSISYVASAGSTPLEREFSRASLRILCGTSAVQALQELPERLDVPGINLMVSALSISARTGAPLQGLFLKAARLVERRFELERELMAKTAQVRLSVRLVSALPAVMVFLLALLSPDYREGITSAAGSVCLGVAIVLDITALFIIKRLMKGVV